MYIYRARQKNTPTKELLLITHQPFKMIIGISVQNSAL